MPSTDLKPMSDFDPAQPAILHDRTNDKIETWTGEEADDYLRHAVVHENGTVGWRGRILDGWSEVLGG